MQSTGRNARGSASRTRLTAYAAFALAALLTAAEAAPTRTLKRFEGTDGQWPSAGLVMGAGGVLYGTTRIGGSMNFGTVFSLTPSAEGGNRWRHRVLHNFASVDGREPFGDLVLDPDGALFGTTSEGGPGRGVVFRLTPPAEGKNKWKMTTLHSFQGGADDGLIPVGGVIRASDGALFGTTLAGGAESLGTAFMLSPPARPAGEWKFRLLTTFVGGKDGSQPNGALTLDANGALFDTTTRGGTVDCDCGTVFMLTAPVAASAADLRARWKKSILHRFTGLPDGHSPYSALVGDGTGTYYGTTYLGGSFDWGTVFKLVPPGMESTKWKLTKLTEFAGTDGYGPLFYGPLAIDENGTLFGTTQNSRIDYTSGTVFSLTPPATGKRWRYRTLHKFRTDGTEGYGPNATVIRNPQGRLFGTTVLGTGEFSAGSVFQVTP
jgi:uncharacterized repeat protein (TIGR03803 family)